MAGSGSVMKELYGLLRDVDKLFEGQVEIVLDDETEGHGEMLRFSMTITPNDGLYKGARCKFGVKIMENYPYQAPVVNCLNNIYHPNINLKDYEGDICVNLLDDNWLPEVGLDGCVMAVLFLFYNPQIDDCLSPVCCGFDDWSDFADNVPKSLRGEEIDGYQFDRLIDIYENKDGVLHTANGVADSENKAVLDGATEVVDDKNKDVLVATTEVVDEKNKAVLEATAPNLVNGMLEIDQPQDFSETVRPCEDVQAAKSRFERAIQSALNGDIPVTTNTPPEVFIIDNESSRENCGNCSSFKIWLSKSEGKICCTSKSDGSQILTGHDWLCSVLVLVCIANGPDN